MRNPEHFATITEPKEAGELLRAIDGYQGNFMTCCALKLAPMLFVRPGELRHAEWTEFDLDAATWKIPGEKMKKKRPLVVPLARQVLAILRELHPLTVRNRHVFGSLRTPTRPMSENTISAALRRLGYEKGTMTGHGFRSIAGTRLREHEDFDWNDDAIERQLAHAEGNKSKAPYDYAKHLPERRKMMQEWADYLDGLRQSAKVISLKGRTAA